MIFSYMWDWKFLERGTLATMFCSINFHAQEWIKSLEEGIYTFSTAQLLNSNCRICKRQFFLCFWNKYEKWLLRINDSDTRDLFFCWCSRMKILHKNSVPRFWQTKLCIFKQKIVCSKIIICMELQVLTNFENHLEN